jgi:hypothetical protein
MESKDHRAFCPGARVLTLARLQIQNKVPLKEKLDQIIDWIDLPLEERPQLIMGASLAFQFDVQPSNST